MQVAWCRRALFAVLSLVTLATGAWSSAARADGAAPDAGAPVTPAKRSKAVTALVGICTKQQKTTRTFAPVDAAGARGFKLVVEGGTPTERAELAAGVASAVGQRVERIDLGSLVVSKYIGETEKNLNKVLARAESLDSVLFFDEADALFGTRTETKDAHDRYSDQQISLVLERLRAHEGIVVFGHASKLGEKPRREAARRVHKLVKSSARGAELWPALCSP